MVLLREMGLVVATITAIALVMVMLGSTHCSL